jgi:hypothetical protein
MGGQVVRLSETQHGFELTASDPAFERQMRAAEKIMDRVPGHAEQVGEMNRST